MPLLHSRPAYLDAFVGKVARDCKPYPANPERHYNVPEPRRRRNTWRSAINEKSVVVMREKTLGVIPTSIDKELQAVRPLNSQDAARENASGSG